MTAMVTEAEGWNLTEVYSDVGIPQTYLPSALARKNYHPELLYEQTSFLSE